MSLSIVIGGQYGSEGKGKTAYFWAKRMGASAVVRVGGTNSGHTVYDEEGNKYAFRMLPTASITRNVVSVLPAGAYIDVDILMEEIGQAKIAPGQLKVDHNAIIISKEHKKREQEMNLQESIGSTLSGTGAAVMDRAARKAARAEDIPELSGYVTDTKSYLRDLLAKKEHVIIEGTQGYGLSNYHAKEYPYVTSRDTTAAGFLAETGLSPFDVEHIVLTIRAFPIRVAGHSGTLEKETDWGTVSMESGAGAYFEEKTTVTHKVRRVARFSPDLVKEAILVNQPDVIVLNHMDYIDYANKGQASLSEKQCRFLKEIENGIGRKVDFCGNGEMKMIAMGD